MQFQVDPNRDLNDKHEHEGACEGGVNVRSELATLVSVAEKPSDNGDNGSQGLDRNVPL